MSQHSKHQKPGVDSRRKPADEKQQDINEELERQ